MAEPTDVTEVGEQLYKAVSPLATQDEANKWALLRYCDALIGQAQPVRDQVRDRSDKELGYSILMDVNNTPANALQWLSQFAGVDLGKLRKGINIALRNEFDNPSFEYDATAGAPFSWTSHIGPGTTGIEFLVSETWAALGKKSLKVKGTKDNTATLREMSLVTAPTNRVPVTPGEFLTIQTKLNILNAPTNGFFVEVNWFRADNATEVSENEVNGLLKGATGIHSVKESFLVPAKAAFANITIGALTPTALQLVEYFADEMMASLTATEPPAGEIEYCDGDEKGCEWVGAPGQSNSIKFTEQTEEQFNEAKRFRIKELPSTKRGTPGALIKSIQQYLIGDKTVILQERAGGSAWRIAIITFTEETLNEKLIIEAIEEQLPGGIILEYKVIPATEWIVIRSEYLTWQAVKEAFLTWGGVRSNTPGT